ncbi:MAG: AtpZ/AtpI family protein [Actinomycetota bacterium]
MSRQPPPATRSQTQSSGAAMGKGMSQASYGLSVALGFVFVVLVFWFAGRWIDGVIGTEPWAQVIGAIAGWVAGVFVVYYATRRGLE